MTGTPKRSMNTHTDSRPSKIPKTQYHSDHDKEDKQLQESSMSKNPNTQRYLVAFEYIGTRFSGSQQQPNRRTAVGVLEEAFHKFIGQPVSIVCSSRTDAGVHALSNVCHVDVERISKRKPGEVLPPHEPSVVRRAVNHFLQVNEGDISVIDVRCVPNDFHARFKAEERTYFYRLVSGSEPSIFEKGWAWHVPDELDLYAMQEACKVLVGDHDFSSFRASGCQANSPIRTLDELHVCEVPPTPYFPSITEGEKSNSSSQDSHLCSAKPEVELPINSLPSTDDVADSNNGKTNLEEFGVRRRPRHYVVTARARSFLYHQVRLLVGVLKCAGTGELTTSDVERILNAKTVTAAKPMAPACGLYLGQVKYDLP